MKTLCFSNGQICRNFFRAMITCYEKCLFFCFYSFSFNNKKIQQYQLNKLTETS